MDKTQRQALIAAARGAAQQSYSPYSNYSVGSALLFDDGAIVTGTNVENASYGLTLCAETLAVSKAMAEGKRGGLIAVAVTGPLGEGATPPITPPITPCGRCRQVLNELAALGGTDPIVLCVGADKNGAEEVREVALSALLPHAFGPDHLSV